MMRDARERVAIGDVGEFVLVGAVDMGVPSAKGFPSCQKMNGSLTYETRNARHLGVHGFADSTLRRGVEPDWFDAFPLSVN